MTVEWRQANPLGQWKWEEWARDYVEFCKREKLACDGLAVATFLNATTLNRINNELMDFDHQIKLGIENGTEELRYQLTSLGEIGEAITRHIDFVTEDA